MSLGGAIGSEGPQLWPHKRCPLSLKRAPFDTPYHLTTTIMMNKNAQMVIEMFVKIDNVTKHTK